MARTRTVAGFAYRNPWIGTIGDVQAERMQGVSEVIGFEPMTGDAGFLADGLGVGSQGIAWDGGECKSGSRSRKSRSGRPVG